VTVSRHTAQASVKVSLVGPQIKIHFTLPHDRQNSHRHTERTISPEGGRHLLSLILSDSITFHVTGDPLNVCLLTEPRMFHPVSWPLQSGIRFFQHLTPARQQHALRLACPMGNGTGFPRSTQLIQWMT